MSQSPRCALITGIGGQDGSYLAERLLSEGWEVHGLSWNLGGSQRAERSVPGTTVYDLETSDSAALSTVVQMVSPTHVFHLAGMTSVGETWREPVHATEVNALCTVSLYSACLELQDSQGERVVVVNASSGEIFAGAGISPQTEQTPIVPTSPYGVTKAFGYHMGSVYRARGLPVSSAILYNHESPRRSEAFVSRKISKGVAAIARGGSEPIRLGNIDGYRDWGWAPDVVDCLCRMAEHEEADNFVVATGVAHSVRDFVVAAFGAVGIDDWEAHVSLDPAMIRPTEPATMIGDASKAQAVLGWKPTKDFTDIVTTMVYHDLHAE